MSKVKSRIYHDVAHLQPPPPPMFLSSINFLHLKVSEIKPGQYFISQGHYNKVKGQIKVTPWHCTPTPLTNVPTRFQLPTPYGFRDIAQTRFYRSRSLRQGQRSYQGHTMMLHTYIPNRCPYQISTSYTLWFLRYSLDKVKGKIKVIP